mmetsp:Transcript_9627/g.23697  ORF Transcript_9627/g.23697 Transcript_9627/m.23697 type:complete len:221 (+) Transcript_9627:3-665(+)
MAHLFARVETKNVYQDIRFNGTEEEMARLKEKSSVTYVGNLKHTTKEEQIYELFSKAGMVKRVIMGVDRIQKTPCGFCFVEFFEREDCLRAIECISGTKVDGQIIRCEIDHGFENGRQYGRGKTTGGQVRSEIKEVIDRRKRNRNADDYNRSGYRRNSHGFSVYNPTITMPMRKRQRGPAAAGPGYVGGPMYPSYRGGNAFFNPGLNFGYGRPDDRRKRY